MQDRHQLCQRMPTFPQLLSCPLHWLAASKPSQPSCPFTPCLLLLPFLSPVAAPSPDPQPTVTIFMPAMTALAGLVPWADTGMMHTSRWPWPLALWGFRQGALGEEG